MKFRSSSACVLLTLIACAGKAAGPQQPAPEAAPASAGAESSAVATAELRMPERKLEMAPAAVPALPDADRSCDQLPVYGSDELGEWASTAALDRYDDPRLSPVEQLERLDQYWSWLGDVSVRYMDCERPREFLWIAAMLFEVASRELPAIDRVLANVPPDVGGRDVIAGHRRDYETRIVNMVGLVNMALPNMNFDEDVPGIGERLGETIARVRPLLAPGALDVNVGLLTSAGDRNPHRRQIRAAIAAALK